MAVARATSAEPVGPTFTGMPLDRAVQLRSDPEWVAAQLQAPASRAVVAGQDGVLLDPSGEALLRAPAGPEVSAGDGPILLGIEHGASLFAIDLDRLDAGAAGRLRSTGRVAALREAGATLPRPEAGLAAYVVALLNYHRRHRHCANCGALTELAEAGYSRRCPNCGAVHFPRTDPVAIMLVEHAGRLLLGRRAGWPGNRYSVLAGFISPGESAEEAVVREVREESGIEVYDPVFVASQPWPFPASLMLGFEARADGGQPVARDGELDDVGWFTLEQVRAAVRDGATEMALPPPLSIARYLIDRWLARQGGAG